MLSEDVRLVSANDHLVEPPDLWTSRLPRALVDASPRVVSQQWQFGDVTLAVAALGIRGTDGGMANRVEEMDPAAHDPGPRLKAMDTDGVHASVLMPHVAGFAGERLRHLGDGAAWSAAVRTYNDFALDEFCAADPSRLFAVAILPLHDVDAAAREVTHAADAGARGIALPSDLTGLGLPSLYTGAWTSVLDATADAGLPLAIHIGSGPAPPADTTVGTRLTLASFDALRAAVDVVHSGILLGRPKLRVVFVEGGTAWLPHVAERLDFFLKRDGVWPRGEIRPSELLARQCYATFIDDPPGIRWRGQIGVGRMLWQSDFPHGDSLLVTGGMTQRRWEHAVPKTSGAAPRVSVAFRHSSGAGPH